MVCTFIFISFTGVSNATCVFESEFGFILNCNLKKSSLFRVRNLGGVKAHIGLGKFEIVLRKSKPTFLIYL